MALKVVSIIFIWAAFHIGFMDAFRSDYTHIVTTNSSYKYHKESVNWHVAVSKCKSEDAVLYYPENEYEHMQVKSVFKVDETLWIGISDLRETYVYETVDGRPISQVYNKWHDGQPSDFNNNYHCVEMAYYDFTLFNDDCKGIHLPYICKIKEIISTEEVKTKPANASDKLVTALEWQTMIIQQQAANETAALDRQTEVMENQTTVLERLAEGMLKLTANQVVANENQRSALELLTVATLQQAANQSATLERVALALEKLAADNNNLDVRSQQ